MWVIIGQITRLHTNYRHLEHFLPFLGHSGPPFWEYALMQILQFWSFWAYFGPMDQILTKFLKFIVLQAI